MEYKTKVILIVFLIVFIINGGIIIYYLNQNTADNFITDSMNRISRFAKGLIDSTYYFESEWRNDNESIECELVYDQEELEFGLGKPTIIGSKCNSKVRDIGYLFCNETKELLIQKPVLYPTPSADKGEDLNVNVYDKYWNKDKYYSQNVEYIQGNNYPSFYVKNDKDKRTFICITWERYIGGSKIEMD